MKSTTSLVAGGAGFLGSHLVERLLDEGQEVIVVDDFSTGSEDNLNSLPSNQRLKIIKHDITQALDIKADEIWNLACPASPVAYQKDPIQTMKTSFLGSLNLLDLANRYNARILFASTSEVYGDPVVNPQSEEYWGNVNPIGLRSCYDEGKRSAESLFFDYQRKHAVDMRICRIFNTYGPRMQADDGRVVSNFITQAISGQPLTVYGLGNQSRSFCYVDDLIDGILKLMRSGEKNISPVNLGNSNEITMLELANLIIASTGSTSTISFEPLPSDDPQKRRPDLSKANRLLNWSPTVDLVEGLQRTINYFRLLSDNQD